MGVFSRFMDIVNANINALLDKAEDPEKMVKLMMQEVEDTLIELKSSCASMIAKEKESLRKKSEAEHKVERWQSRAELAIDKGRDELAKEALLEKKRVNDEISRYQEDALYYEKLVVKSKDDINRLEEKLLSLKEKHRSIIEENRNSEQETSFAKQSTLDRFEQMERQFDRMKYYDQHSSTEKQFAELEELEEIASELEALKKSRRKESST
ncbi:MAG: PspA/IM30 family protein [Sphaerochaetaceae bacterium]|jgi:phage shock protein A